MRMQITFKSGAQIEVDVEEFTTGRSPLNNELVKLNWTTPADAAAKLHTIEIDDIVAVVALRPPAVTE